MTDYFFAIGYMPHRLWGKILIAHYLEKEADSPYYVSENILQVNEQSDSFQELSPLQKEVVHILDQYSERNLHRLFSKKKSVKEFHDTVDEKTISVFIRPFIERHIYKALRLAAENNFKVFHKEKGIQNIFEEDFYKIHKESANPLFHFNREADATYYKLSIFHQDTPIRLDLDFAEVICNKPAVVLLDKEIYFVDDIEGMKLRPFFNKNSITVQKSAEKKYFTTFISKVLKEYENIDTKGFEVQDIIPNKKAVISLEKGLSQQAVWVLQLQYNDLKLLPASRQKRFVKFSSQNDHFSFTRFKRDEEWEDKLDILLSEIGLKTHDRNVYFQKKASNINVENQIFEAINFTNDHFDFLTENGFEVLQKLDKQYYLKEFELVIKSTEREDWFDLHAVVRLENFEFPFTKLRKHILSGNRLYELPDHTFAVIPLEWFTRYRQLFEFGKTEGEFLKIHKQHFSQVDSAMRKNHLTTFDNLEKLKNPENLPVKELPKGLNVNMRKYQAEGYSWLKFLEENGFGGCLADDMGLGKTLQTIAVLQSNKEQIVSGSSENSREEGQLSLFQPDHSSPVSLVVVPASLIQNWINEIEKFAPSLKVYAHVGQHRKKTTLNYAYFDVVVSSYHTIRHDIEFIRDYTFHYVILDESQMIKNPTSKLYRAMEELQAKHKLVLTGTPIENSLTDLWSQINFVNEGLLGTLNFFKKEFVQAIEKKQNREKEQRLKELIRPFILRRTKDEVAKELPPVYEQYRYCNMTEEQKRFYEEEKSSVRNALFDNLENTGMGKSAIMVLQALTKLRQISNHPLLVDEDYEYGSGKFTEVFMDIESVVSENHKVLVFSSFVKHLNLYAQKLDEMGWEYAYLTGSTTNRAEVVRRFQEDENCKIFLISLKAGGVGLNLTAADYVFILDPWWNPAAELQALSRAHRIGQDKNVFVYRFISNQTVEEKILRLQAEKSKLAEAFISSNNPLKEMKKKDIIELFI